MRITVRVKAGSRYEKVEKLSAAEYLVCTKALPIEGKANEDVRDLLRRYFGLPRSKIVLLRGQKSKVKLFEIILN